MTRTTYDVRTADANTGEILPSRFGLIAADSPEAAIAFAAEAMGFDDSADMINDYATNSYRPQRVVAIASSKPADYTA